MKKSNKYFFQINIFLLGLTLMLTSLDTVMAETSKQNVVKLNRHFVFDTIPTTIKDQSSGSDIFEGVVLEKTQKKCEGIDIVEYKFQLAECIKINGKKVNSCPQDTLTFNQWDALEKDSGYEVGHKYFLSLHGKSKKCNLQSSFAAGQGRYEIKAVKGEGIVAGPVRVSNIGSNYGLVRHYKTKTTLPLKDTVLLKRLENDSATGSVRYDDLKSAFKDLVDQEN